MNIIKATGEKQTTAHNLHLINRNTLSITGITKVKSASDRGVLLELANTHLCITGTNLQVNQFDITTGAIEIIGTIDKIDYQQHKPLLKKLFK